MAFAAFWTGLSELAPGLYIRIFMRPTDAILAIAPSIIRRYSVSFILLPVNIFSTYYFKSRLAHQARKPLKTLRFRGFCCVYAETGVFP